MSSALVALAAVAALVGNAPTVNRPIGQMVGVQPSQLEGAARTQAVWELHFHVRRKTGQGIALRAFSRT